MSARSAERVAMVQAARQGSGFLLTSRLVLTSAHLFDGSEDARVAVPGGTGVRRGRILWRRRDASCDAALLECADDLVADPATCRISDVRWGRVAGLASRENCEAVGYPRISLGAGKRPDTEQIVGTLKPGSSLLRGRYVLDSAHSPPPPGPDGSLSPWQGMSGAALFAGEYLIGVVCGDPVQWGHARVEAVPVSVLAGDPAFERAVWESSGVRPELTDIAGPLTQAVNPLPESGAFDWQPVREADPVAFGIHRAPEAPGHSHVVEYVSRAVDGQLDGHLDALADSGGMLLLTGDSAAGKTRALFESMRRKLAGRLVCKPDPDAELSALLSRTGDAAGIVWLDDLHDYLRSDGLTLPLLDGLVSRRMLVLATLRTEFYEHYTGEKDAPSPTRGTDPRLPSSPGRILRRARHLTLERLWTDGERRNASRSADPRLTEALRSDRAYGVAEYLAAGPQVLKTWRSASRVKGNPRGAALVAAAIDLVRTGVGSALPPDAVERLHEHHLDRAGGPALRPEGLDEAWDWAGRIVLGVTSPLVPGRGGTWKPCDYLVSDVARRARPADLPAEVWAEALRIVDDARRVLVSTVARAAGRPDVAKDVLGPLVAVDDPEALVTYGALLAAENDHEGAAVRFRRASDLGDPTGAHNMGSLCVARGALEDARDWYTLAVERGELPSIGALGLVHQKMGNQEEATSLWKRGTEAGDPGSALHYSDWLSSQWQSDEAVAALRIAADGAIPYAALSYAGVLLRREDHEAANAYVSKAYDAAVRQGELGEPVGHLMAGVIDYSFGDVRAGGESWSRARAKGCPLDWHVVEAADGVPGLRYLAVGSDTLDRLGEEGVRRLMRMLWAKDCLECGYPLQDGVPALYVDDRYTTADARLFHFGLCRYPRWNDSALVPSAKDVGISWEAFTTAVQAGGGLFPALVVNPALEAAHLVLDDRVWTPTSRYGPRSPLSPHLRLRPLKDGFPRRSADSPVRAFARGGEVAVSALVECWSAPAVPEFVALVKRHRGVLLIMTSAFEPESPPSAEMLAAVLESPESTACWAPLGS
ncbi:trypsin-like peptidase domain-containing protein [Streptomyces sp. NPDC007100]|uniref:trypsin-like peptidase domain-containing protein n=1 Tax=Streptomyces sp. NPDC007100 TaxID=3155602 RepID=UPI0033F29A5D